VFLEKKSPKKNERGREMQKGKILSRGLAKKERQSSERGEEETTQKHSGKGSEGKKAKTRWRCRLKRNHRRVESLLQTLKFGSEGKTGEEEKIGKKNRPREKRGESERHVQGTIGGVHIGGGEGWGGKFY